MASEQNWDDMPIAAAARRAAAVRSLNALKISKPEKPRIIAVSNQKGGVGKTTSCVNLAAALVVGGLRVLVIDLDPQGNASTALGVPHNVGTTSSYEMLVNKVPAEDAIQPSTFNENLLCIPATIDLAGAEIELVSLVRREYRLVDAINPTFLAENNIDFVIIDCPPSLGLLTINAMTAATEVLIPIQCEYYALEGVGQLLNSITMIREHLNADLHISNILLTMYDARTKLANQVATEVKEHFGSVVLNTIIPRSVKVSEAPGFSQTILAYDPGSVGASAYLDAANEMASRGDYLPSAESGVIGVAPELHEQAAKEAAEEAAEAVEEVAEEAAKGAAVEEAKSEAAAAVEAAEAIEKAEATEETEAVRATKAAKSAGKSAKQQED